MFIGQGYRITGVAEGEVEGEGGTEFVSWWAGNHLLGVYNLMALFPLAYTGSSAVSALSKVRYLVGRAFCHCYELRASTRSIMNKKRNLPIPPLVGKIFGIIISANCRWV